MKIIHNLILLTLIVSVNSCSNKTFSKNSTNIKESFLSNNSDIPLFFDFDIIDEETLDFDSSSGNISHITYKSNAKISDIVKFYENNLKNLGWQQIDKSKNHLSFNRGSEILKISYNKLDKNIVVKFFIVKTNG